MPLLDSTREMYSDLVVAQGQYEGEQFVNHYFARVIVKGTATISPLGTPLVYNPTADAFNVYVAQDINPTSGTYVLAAEPSTLPGGVYPVAVTVGTKEGYGFNKADVTLNNTDGVEMTVVFRGDITLSNSKMKWGTATAAAQAAFKQAMARADVHFVDPAETVDPVFVV